MQFGFLIHACGDFVPIKDSLRKNCVLIIFCCIIIVITSMPTKVMMIKDGMVGM